MITLAFLLDHQVISRSDKNTVVAGSKNYVRARFILRTDDWARPITAIFGGYTQLLDDNNECTVPWEVLQQPGKVEVSAFCGDLHTANIAVVPVEKTGYKSGETPKDPTPDVYDQLAKMVQEAVDTANSVREDADAGDFDGEQGPAGPKGDTGLGVPSPAQSDAGKVPTVKADGSTYELAGPYAPLSAAIRPTASGNPVSITDSVEWPLLGLKVYGKSTQDGTPSPESPVPIVSAGDGGSIDLTVSNGADLSQSMSISTPNGLPSIPVESGGNFTDADGQQLVCDVKDYGAGIKTQNLTSIIFDGSSDERWQQNKAGIFIKLDPPAKNAVKGTAICSIAIPCGGYAELETGQLGVRPTASGNSLGFFFYNNQQPTLEEWKNQLSQTPVQVLYILFAPITTPLSDEELAAYRALHTYDDATVVSTPEDVTGIEVRYVANGEKYIDRKISEAIASAAATQLASYDALSDAIHEGVNEA